MKNIIKNFLPVVFSSIFPMTALAQLGGLGNLLGEAKMLVSGSIYLLAGLALLTFFWGLVKFIFAQGSETVKTESKKVMLWGLIALFVMISVWGIVRFMQDALLSGADFSAPPVPTF